jgi:hypothetical protein
MRDLLDTMLRGARLRRHAIVWAVGLAPALLVAACGWRFGGLEAVCALLVSSLLLLTMASVLHARRVDRRWVIRRLDRHRALEDSADLLLMPEGSLGPLQSLQRERILQRLHAGAYDVRAPWPRHLLLAVVLPALLLTGAVLCWPERPTPPALSPSATPPSAIATHPALQSSQLRATPPAYTGLPSSTLPALDAKVPEGTALSWTLRFNRQPRRVELHLHDGRVLALLREGQAWRLRMPLQRSTLYRIVVDGRPVDENLHRLESIADRPPQVRVLAPESSLVQWSPESGRWTLRFEANDDYGVATVAQLRLTLAQGSGENISFREQTLALSGTGPATARRFERVLQPQALGMEPGNDLIAQLVVRDSRQPKPQEGRSSSVILRWPPAEQALAADLEGSVKRSMPAYFRSQRQIIIDAEALLKQQRSLSSEDYLKQSDAIGVDQRLLRLRYGQFLGEETEGAPQAPPLAHDETPTADALPVADDLPVADMPTADAPAPTSPQASADDAHGHDDAHDDHGTAGAAALDDHGHGSQARREGFGSQGDVLAEFGHTHDHAEAATLLDPETRATLKAALDQMWQSEGELRQGRPDRALPFAYKALGLIKQVQQAERIYLARVGPELPPIDPGRRMGGKREGLASRTLTLAQRTPPDPQVIALWQSLGEAPDQSESARLAAVSRWLASREGDSADTLDLAASLETLRSTPACSACRQRLRAQLWTWLLPPPARPQPRAAPTSAGQRYLQALQREAAP